MSRQNEKSIPIKEFKEKCIEIQAKKLKVIIDMTFKDLSKIV